MILFRHLGNDEIIKFSSLSLNFPINESYWRKFNDIELDNFIERIFRYYRAVGFPYYNLNNDTLAYEIVKAREYLGNNLVIQGDTILQSMHGLAVCWKFFPHHNSVRCGNAITPMEAFMDDDILRKVIRKRLSFGTYLSDSGIRKTLKIATGLQGVSNFRPTAASAIYRKYGGGAVYDMSSGFGGRLLGALLTKSVSSYIGVDPCTATYEGLVKLKNTVDHNKQVTILKIGSEDYEPEKDSLDICFTSPPYFNTEKYSDETTQSYIKFPNTEVWLRKFIGTTVSNCVYGLKSGGYVIFNIANVKSFPDLEIKFLKLMKMFEVTHVDTLKYSLSAICKAGFKYEPVFVFQKD